LDLQITKYILVHNLWTLMSDRHIFFINFLM
jgi:hypothetical protein